MNEWLQKRLKSLESLIAVQRQSVIGNDPHVDYMHGLLNGMIMSHSVFSDLKPAFHKRKSKRHDTKIRHKGKR